MPITSHSTFTYLDEFNVVPTPIHIASNNKFMTFPPLNAKQNQSQITTQAECDKKKQRHKQHKIMIA